MNSHVYLMQKRRLPPVDQTFRGRSRSGCGQVKPTPEKKPSPPAGKSLAFPFCGQEKLNGKRRAALEAD
jgi:hypothetical protein